MVVGRWVSFWGKRPIFGCELFVLGRVSTMTGKHNPQNLYDPLFNLILWVVQDPSFWGFGATVIFVHWIDIGNKFRFGKDGEKHAKSGPMMVSGWEYVWFVCNMKTIYIYIYILSICDYIIIYHNHLICKWKEIHYFSQTSTQKPPIAERTIWAVLKTLVGCLI